MRDLRRREVKEEQHSVPTPRLGQRESPYGAELTETQKTGSRRQGPLGLRETAEPGGAGPGAEGAEGAAAGRQELRGAGVPG